MSNQIKPQTLKGFRDFLPQEMLKRQYVIEKLKAVFERFGFDPLETPALEYAETLLGKYGEEANKLLYLFKDQGGRLVGLRYDQTVPLARVVAQYKNQIVFPFKRYQIQPVWRAENPQMGRFREFLQCDIDTVGSQGVFADGEIIVCTVAAAKSLGFKKVKMLINDRSIFANLLPKFVTAIDKLAKIGKEKVIKELIGKGMDKEEAKKLISSFDRQKPTPLINSLFKLLKENGLVENTDFSFEPTLARGLDYYTSTIFELICEDYKGGSIGGGGRYDKLIGQFIGQEIPAVGFSFGFDRLIEALEQLNILVDKKTTTQVLITIFSQSFLSKSLSLTFFLRDQGINTEVYLNGTDVKLDKQLKYADRKGIPFVIIIGPEEAEKGAVKVKNMKTGEQKEVKENDLINLLV